MVRLGVLVDGSEVEVAGFKLRVYGRGAWRVYERIGPEGGEESRAYISRSSRVMLVPYPPFLLPVQDLADCLYIRLRAPVVVPSGSSARFFVAVPFDYAVIAAGGGSHTLVDIFPSEAGPPKMAVYGDVLDGMMCRFHRSDVDPEPWPPGTAVAEVELVNESGEQVSVTRIVAPRRGLTMLYNPATGEVVASRISMRVKGPGEAEVWYQPPPELEGFAAVPIVEREKRLLEVLSGRLQPKITMTWGL
jgi:hypothetical protein